MTNLARSKASGDFHTPLLKRGGYPESKSTLDRTDGITDKEEDNLPRKPT